MREPTEIVVFITTETDEEARKIGNHLVEHRKAACVNVIPRVNSLFWWKGKLDTAEERLLVVKTRASLLPEIVARVKSLHSYEVPEVIAMPIIGGNEDYLGWIRAEVEG